MTGYDSYASQLLLSIPGQCTLASHGSHSYCLGKVHMYSV